MQSSSQAASNSQCVCKQCETEWFKCEQVLGPDLSKRCKRSVAESYQQSSRLFVRHPEASCHYHSHLAHYRFSLAVPLDLHTTPLRPSPSRSHPQQFCFGHHTLGFTVDVRVGNKVYPKSSQSGKIPVARLNTIRTWDHATRGDYTIASPGFGWLLSSPIPLTIHHRCLPPTSIPYSSNYFVLCSKCLLHTLVSLSLYHCRSYSTRHILLNVDYRVLAVVSTSGVRSSSSPSTPHPESTVVPDPRSREPPPGPSSTSRRHRPSPSTIGAPNLYSLTTSFSSPPVNSTVAGNGPATDAELLPGSPRKPSGERYRG
jgi:hypothetical protein